MGICKKKNNIMKKLDNIVQTLCKWYFSKRGITVYFNISVGTSFNPTTKITI